MTPLEDMLSEVLATVEQYGDWLNHSNNAVTEQHQSINAVCDSDRLTLTEMADNVTSVIDTMRDLTEEVVADATRVTRVLDSLQEQINDENRPDVETGVNGNE